jgi:hypothetical protein
MSNLSLPSVILLGVGTVLIYSAVKDVNPKDVIGEALGNGKAKTYIDPDREPYQSDPDVDPNHDPSNPSNQNAASTIPPTFLTQEA